MDDRKLETLLTTIRKGSFSKAAEELSCTQSAVTQAMNAIESELGFKVLERTHSGIRLTQQGQDLLPYIIDAQNSLKTLADEAAGIAVGKQRPIRIGTFSSIANTWLPEIIKKYRETVPDAAFDISVGTYDIVRWFLEDSIDIALGDEDRIKAFRWYPLMTENYLAVMPDNLVSPDRDTITQEEFAKHNFIMALTMDKKLNVLSSAQTVVRTDDDSTLANMVSKGLGVTIIPELSLKSMQAIPDNVVILNLDPAPVRTLGIGVANNISRSTSDFVSFLRKNMGK